MANVLDYLTWRGDVPLSCVPFNDVDNLILSQCAYILFEFAPSLEAGLSVRDLSEALGDMPDAFGVLEADNRKLLEKMASGPRFADASVRFYRHDTDLTLEKQFAAVTLVLGDHSAFVAFRGTDNTLVGWKEDINLSFTSPVPAQTEAVRYVCEVAEKIPHPLRLGGHSKGGNLAVYAAANCPASVQSRIERVYSNDGPGMDEATFSGEGYARISDRIRSILPQSSVIGMLLQHQETYTVIQSNAFAIFQHNPYSWQVAPRGFEVVESLRPGSVYVDGVLKKWLESIGVAERSLFVDTLFTVLSQTKATTVGNLTEGRMRHALSVLAAVKSIDIKTRRQLLRILRALFSAVLTRRNG